MSGFDIIEGLFEYVTLMSTTFFLTFFLDVTFVPTSCDIFPGWIGPNGNCTSLSYSLLIIVILLFILYISKKRMDD